MAEYIPDGARVAARRAGDGPFVTSFGDGPAGPERRSAIISNVVSLGEGDRPLPTTDDGQLKAREILERWTPLPRVEAFAQGGGAPAVEPSYCGPNTAVAAAVSRGRPALCRLAWRVSDQGGDTLSAIKKGPIDDVASKRWALVSTATARALDALSELTEPKKTTYGTLSRLALAITTLMTSAHDDHVATTHELLAILGHVGPVRSAGFGRVTDEAAFNAVLDDLKVGQAYHVLVGGRLRTVRGPSTARDERHGWVMLAAVGTKAVSPRIVLYDPHPRDGGRLRFREEPGFWTVFRDGADPGAAFRGGLIATRSGAGIG